MSKLTNLPIWGKVILGVASWIIFIALFMPLYPKIQDAIFVFQVIPVIMWAMLFGRPGGIASGIAIFFINFLLVSTIPGTDVLNVILTRRGLLALFFALMGAVVGRLSELNEVAYTEAKEKEKAQSLYKTLLDTVPEAIILYKPEGIIEFASAKAKTLFGIKDEKDLFGTKAFRHVSKDSKADVQNAFRNMLDDKEDINGIVYRLLKNDGTKFWGEVYASRVKDESGKVVKVIATIRDITERKETEDESLRRTQELEKLTNLMVGRENKMIELKKQIKDLQK